MAVPKEVADDPGGLTLNAVIDKQLKDSDRLANPGEGKHRQGTADNFEVALQNYTDHLRVYRRGLEDSRTAMSMALAGDGDGESVFSAAKQEKGVTLDCQAARSTTRKSEYERVPALDQLARAAKDVDDARSRKEALDKAADLHNDSPYSRDMLDLASAPFGMDWDDAVGNVSVTQPDSSTGAVMHEGSVEQKIGHCVACGETKDSSDVARALCDHEYCRECLTHLFQASLRDESLFPPWCDGQPIPLDRVRSLLPADLAQEFEERFEELSTKDRVYCHDPACSAFIPKPLSFSKRMKADRAVCLRCEKKTRTICKAAAHAGDCPNDTSLQELVETAKKEQWQRCYQCRRFLELIHGCNHMTCPCGAQFCYVCGSKWKTCRCPQVDERSVARMALPEPLQERHAVHAMHAMREQRRTRRHLRAQRAAAASAQGGRTRLPSADSGFVRDSHLLDDAVWEQDWSEDASRAFEPASRVFDPSRYPIVSDHLLAPQAGLHLLDHEEWEQHWVWDSARASEFSSRVFDPSRYPGYLYGPLAPQTGPTLQPSTSMTTAPDPAIYFDANTIRASRDANASLTSASATNVDARPSGTRRDAIASHSPFLEPTWMHGSTLLPVMRPLITWSLTLVVCGTIALTAIGAGLEGQTVAVSAKTPSAKTSTNVGGASSNPAQTAGRTGGFENQLTLTGTQH